MKNRKPEMEKVMCDARLQRYAQHCGQV